MAKLALERTPETEQKILDLHFGQEVLSHQIAKQLKTDKIWVIDEVIKDEETRRKNNLIKLISKGKSYQEDLISWVKYSRVVRKKAYYEIAQELGVDELKIYDIVFFQKVTKKANGKYAENSFTRAELLYRNGKMTELNIAGKPLSEIADVYHLTRQRVSYIFQEIGYVPIATKSIKTMAHTKYLPHLNQIMTDEVKEQITNLKKEIRTTKQKAAVAKFHYNKVIMKLRCSYLIKMTKAWDEADRPDYIANRRTLVIIYNELTRDMSNYTSEYQLIEETLRALAKFEKANKIEVRGDSLTKLFPDI